MGPLELKRRELIAAFLGGAVALSACRRSKAARPRIPGAIVDRGFELGHRMRDAKALAAPPAFEKVPVVVVGGGAAGMSAAWRLRGGGVSDLRVLELDDEVGGTSRSGRSEVSAFPWGAHYLPAPLRAKGPVAKLLSEVGAITGVDEQGRPQFAEQHLVRDPDERVYFKGHWYEGLYLRSGASAEDLSELARFEAKMAAFSTARDGKGKKAFAVPISEASDDAEWTALDGISMAAWLDEEGFRSARLRWWVDYACRDDFGTTAGEVSAWAGIFYFAARHEGEERNAGYLTWPEGNGRLIRQLSSSLSPSSVLRNVAVHTVRPTAAGVELHAVAADGSPRGFLAEQVVLAAPRFVTRRIYEPWRRDPPDDGGTFVYGPWVVANLTLSSPPFSRGFPLAWDNVLYESQSLGYVVATHQVERAYDEGPSVWTWYYPCVGADVTAERKRALSASYEDWETLVMADLGPSHRGLSERAQKLEVFRHGHAMARPLPGTLFSLARKASRESPEARVHLAHSDLSGLPLFEEACDRGVRAAERVLSGLGRSSPSWL